MSSDNTMNSDNNKKNNNKPISNSSSLQKEEPLSEEMSNSEIMLDWSNTELLPTINILLKESKRAKERSNSEKLFMLLKKYTSPNQIIKKKTFEEEDTASDDDSELISPNEYDSSNTDNSDDPKSDIPFDPNEIFEDCETFKTIIQNKHFQGDKNDEDLQNMFVEQEKLVDRLEKLRKLERMKQRFLNGDTTPELLSSLQQILEIFDNHKTEQNPESKANRRGGLPLDYQKIIDVIDRFMEARDSGKRTDNLDILDSFDKLNNIDNLDNIDNFDNSDNSDDHSSSEIDSFFSSRKMTENDEQRMAALGDEIDNLGLENCINNADDGSGDDEPFSLLNEDQESGDDQTDEDSEGADTNLPDEDQFSETEEETHEENDPHKCSEGTDIMSKWFRKVFVETKNQKETEENQATSNFFAKISAVIMEDDRDIRMDTDLVLMPQEYLSPCRTADPLSEDKIFDEYPVDDMDDDDDLDSSDDDSDEEPDPWESEIDEEEIAESAGQPKETWSLPEEFPEDGPVTKERIAKLRKLIKKGDTEKRSILIRYLMIYVAENHEELIQDQAFEMLNESEKIIRQLLQNGESEALILHARLLNEKSFLYYFYSSNDDKSVPLEASQEAIRIISGYLDNSLTEKEEIREQLAIALRIRADSFEQNRAFNSALNERLREEQVRGEFESAFDDSKQREMVNVYLGLAANYCNLGDFENALNRYRQGLDLLEQLVSEGKACEALLINTSYRVAMVYRQLHQSDNGLALLRKLLDRERRYIVSMADDLRIMAVYLNHLQIMSDFLIWTNSFQELPAFQEELIRLCEDLYKKAILSNNPLASFYLVSLGDIWRMKSMTTSNSDEADEALHRSFQIYILACRRFNLDIKPYIVDIGAHKISFLREKMGEADLLRQLEPLTSLLEKILAEDRDKVVSLYPRLLHHQGHLQCILNEKKKALTLLNKCLKYWEHIVEDEGRVMWRDSYAASFGERGTYYFHNTEDYPKALSDFNRSTQILYELVEEEKDYSQLGLYTAAIIDRARVLLKLKRNEEAFTSLYDLFEFWINILTEKKAVDNLEIVRDFVQILMSLIVHSRDTEHSQGRLGEILDGFYKLRKVYEQDNSFDHLNVVEQIDQITFSLEFLSLIILDFQDDHKAFPVQMEKMLASFREYVLNGETGMIDRGCALLRRYSVETETVKGNQRALEFIDRLINELLESFRAGLLEPSDSYSSLFTQRNSFYIDLDEKNPERFSLVTYSFNQLKEFAELVQKTDFNEGTILFVISQIDYALFLVNTDKEKEALEILYDGEKQLAQLDLKTDAESKESGLNAKTDLNEQLLPLKGTLKFYLGCLYRNPDPDKAISYFEEALKFFNEAIKVTQLSNEALSCMADTHRHYARLLVKSDPNGAIKHICLAREIFTLLQTQNEESKSAIAISLFELDLLAGDIFNDKSLPELKNSQKAIDAFCQAEKDFFEMDEMNQLTRFSNLFGAWVSLVDLFWSNWRYKDLLDLNKRMELFENAFKDLGNYEDLCRYCIIRYQMAYYFLIQSMAPLSLEVINQADEFFKSQTSGKKVDPSFTHLFAIMVASVRGWALRELGRFQEALDDLTAIQKLVRKDVSHVIKTIQKESSPKPEQKYELIFHYRNMIMAISVNLIRLHKYARALRLLDEAQKLTKMILPIIPSDIVNLTFIRTVESEVFYMKKDYQSSLERIEGALEILDQKKKEFPVNFGEALRWKGAALWKLGRHAEAHTVCDEGIVCLAEEFDSIRKRGCFELVDLFVVKAKFLLEEKNTGGGINLLQGALSLLKKAKKENLVCNQDFTTEINGLIQKYEGGLMKKNRKQEKKEKKK